VPIHLFLNNQGFLVLGASLRPDRTQVVAAGLSGQFREVASFPTPREPDLLVRELHRTVRGMGGGFRHLGLSVAGLVRATTGEIAWMSACPKYSGFAMGDALRKKLGIPVSVENDCNLGALAEMWLSETDVAGLDDFIFLEIGDAGVGAGMIHERRVYQGHDTTFAAEFGHMVVDPHGPACQCGRRGCWRMYVSNDATIRRYSGRGRRVGFDSLVDLAFAGDKAATEALAETGRYLSLGVSNIVFALNPEKILVAGRITRAWPIIGSLIEREFVSSSIRINIAPARLNAEELFLHGAVHLALSDVYAQPKFGW
jgi:predicted NBD/HSP70 family sugar kinase